MKKGTASGGGVAMDHGGVTMTEGGGATPTAAPSLRRRGPHWRSGGRREDAPAVPAGRGGAGWTEQRGATRPREPGGAARAAGKKETWQRRRLAGPSSTTPAAVTCHPNRDSAGRGSRDSALAGRHAPPWPLLPARNTPAVELPEPGAGSKGQVARMAPGAARTARGREDVPPDGTARGRGSRHSTLGLWAGENSAGDVTVRPRPCRRRAARPSRPVARDALLGREQRGMRRPATPPTSWTGRTPHAVTTRPRSGGGRAT